MSSAKHAITLFYDSISHEKEPTVSGTVSGIGGRDLVGYTLQFVNEDCTPWWRSVWIRLPENGEFLTTIFVQRRGRNLVRIMLCDAQGTSQPTAPEDFAIQVEADVTQPYLERSLGFALASGDTAFFMERGTPLPARYRSTLRTIRNFQRGAGTAIRVPVVEGVSSRAERNRLVGMIELPDSEIRCDLPGGSKIEITISVDSSRLVTWKASIEYLDQTFQAVLNADLSQGTKNELGPDIESDVCS